MSNSLMATGSSVLEQRAAEACAVISDLSVPLRDLWNPWRCPVKFLPYLAWAFSVDRWDDVWTEAEKRQAIANAFWMHQRKGTIAAVRRVIEDMGFSMALAEWWQVNDPAGTFRLEINVNDVGLSNKYLDELNRLISVTKPVSRHISQLTIATHVTGLIHAGAALYGGDIISIYPEEYEPDDSLFYNGIVFHDGNNSYR
ncbi:phage tail protein I [Klebsiella pneumoniae]|uniref:phage tail protein I n=1 Tax=Klebsiella pneumoniae TaxID=573 RepID=UPI00050CD32B|nr:phage tail protein I [Klebsiella pneumoniae]EJR0216600.1 phage tail protein I [Klebsiella pneumoniae]EKU9286742.1 phage tail protein I [Klebsiella pneumoniae]EKX3233561.1 phage tail protein I [Klebsiella pneumoniae]EKX3999476.1 phage tail protein I [Klebsiella pneumoniae]EKX4056388.1 phage tail protein I [Klebsiella pneumoniae]